MIMKRIDSDEGDEFAAGLDFSPGVNAASPIDGLNSHCVGYLYRGVPQDRSIKDLRLDRTASCSSVAVPKWMTMCLVAESIPTELFFG